MTAIRSDHGHPKITLAKTEPSTHDGVDNAFNQTIQDIHAGRVPYKHLHIDFDSALREGLYQRICLVKGVDWSAEEEAEWRQKIIAFYGDGADEELFCIPSASSGSWLPSPLIEARMTVDAPVLRLELPANYMHLPKHEQATMLAPFLAELEEALGGIDLGPHYAFGFDFGRVSDLSTISVLAIEQRLKRREALALEMRNVPGTEQKLIVGMVLETLKERLVGAAFDATGMGWTVAEDMGRKFGLREDPEGPGLVWAIKFSEEWYRLQMPPLKDAFEGDLIAIIRDDDHLSDLRAVKLLRGIPRVPPTREGEKGKKRHGDYAIALALAHFASRMRWVGGDPAKALPDGWQMRDQDGALSGIDKGWDYAPGATASASILTLKDKLPALPAQIGSRMFAAWPNAGPSLDAEFAKFVDKALSEFVQHRHMVIGALKPKWVDEAIRLGVKPQTAEIAVTDDDVQHTFRGTALVTAPSTKIGQMAPKVAPFDLAWYKTIPGRLQAPTAVLLDPRTTPVFFLVYDTPGSPSKLVIKINAVLKKTKSVVNTLRSGRLVTTQDLKADIAAGVILIEGKV